MLKVPRESLDMALCLEFNELDRALLHCLSDITQQVIRDEIYADQSRYIVNGICAWLPNSICDRKY
jgi:hypothetical protein